MSVTPQQRKHDDRPVLTTAQASQLSGLSRDYILRLLSNGRIEGVQPLGREWMVYEDSLQAFLAQPRSKGKAGERGPRKKRIIRHTEHGDRILLSTAEAQDLTGYARDTILRLLRSGRITGEKSGRTWLVFEDSLLAYKQRKHPVIVESTLVRPEESPATLPEASGKQPAESRSDPPSSESLPLPESPAPLPDK